VKQLFQELVAEVRRINPSAAELLRPGLSPEVAKQKLAAMAFQVTPDAAALYTWADGADGRFEMLPGAYFIPLNEALLEFEEVHGIRDELEQIFPERSSQGEIVHCCIHAPWLLAFHDLADLLKTEGTRYQPLSCSSKISLLISRRNSRACSSLSHSGSK
jgi:hypothetical protein